MTLLYDVNTVPTTGSKAGFQLKTLMKSAGWVVKSSGDGLSAFSSSTDILTSGNSGANGLGNSNAWFRIQSPLLKEFVFQVSSDTAWKIKYSAQSLFTGGSPSATVFPTAADEQYLLGTSGGFATWFNTNNGYRYYMCANNSDGYGVFATGLNVGNTSSSGSTGSFLYDPMQAGSYNLS
ncbi:MAG TPA: hypothetical protein VM577_18565, partial [Anaerovoracaceae bacterium]|nr:hypothetical protein [Anaerovoracaceae bacterium]